MDSNQKQRIERLRTQGESYGSIAKQLGVSVNTIKSYCQRNNLGGRVGTSCVGKQIEQKFCKACGEKLNQVPGHKPRKFCSDICRMGWWNAHLEQVNKKAFYRITCAHCGLEFNSYGNRSRKYCSHPCYIYHRFGTKAGEKS